MIRQAGKSRSFYFPFTEELKMQTQSGTAQANGVDISGTRPVSREKAAYASSNIGRSKIFDRLVDQTKFNLEAAGAQYYIVLQDGTVLANFDPKAKVKSAKVRGSVRPRRPREHRFTTIYKHDIQSMEVGQLKAFEYEPYGYRVNEAQSALCAMMVHAFGKGSYTTSREESDGVKAIHILRVR